MTHALCADQKTRLTAKALHKKRQNLLPKKSDITPKKIDPAIIPATNND